ncbi:16S rRNA (guanine(527)-N(7))-methyltransferase RsmG [Caulobacter vibrioides]|uniref:Ribosomal RNA small subunit methyltransferase G n=1 Tax=Caulobacter vibrioides TaxID=155892 RepID=A0A290N1Z8_CAUVI|nr:16S rRNA (guanine(527)-N(7))-methyltransferase RsmG [Caulobacter vibrioides]ATC33613.1 16S rRNA (guanine(527)-N(7))-methyltransferase RsmG [Caulobacter vibrioides]
MQPDLALAPETTLDAAGFQALVGATDAQIEDLARFQELLAEWNEVMNLVGPLTIATYWTRHVLDSAQLIPLAPDATTWADLGAGAGLPGVVLAILLKGRAGAKVHLVESMAKRCRFLEVVAKDLDLPVQIHNARAEDLKLKVEVVTARACAPMTKLLGFAEPYLHKGALGLFLKGQDVEAELAEARKAWTFESQLRTSQSDPRGRIVQVKRLSRVR